MKDSTIVATVGLCATTAVSITAIAAGINGVVFAGTLSAITFIVGLAFGVKVIQKFGK